VVNVSDEVVGKVELKDDSLLMEYKLKFGISKKFSKEFDVTVEFDKGLKENIMKWLSGFSSEIERYKQLEKVHRYAATAVIFLINSGSGMPAKLAISNSIMRELYDVLNMPMYELKKFDEKQLRTFKKTPDEFSTEYTNAICDSFSMLIKYSRLDTAQPFDENFQNLSGVVYTRLVDGLAHELDTDENEDVFVESSFKMFEKGEEGNFDKFVEGSSELYEDAESFMKTFMPYMMKVKGYKIEYNSEEKYEYDMFEDKEFTRTTVNVKPSIWQKVVLDCLVELHNENKRGYFYIEPPVESLVGNGSDLRGLAWAERATPNAIGERLTNHTIRIRDVWSHVKRTLSENRIKRIKYRERESELFPGDCIEAEIIKYLDILIDRGYLYSLNTRIGHDDEYSYRLTPAFKVYGDVMIQ